MNPHHFLAAPNIGRKMIDAKQPLTCPCGGHYLRKHKGRHLRTLKHKRFLVVCELDLAAVYNKENDIEDVNPMFAF